MTEKDFLYPLFSLHPIVVFAITLVFCIATLVIVPLKTKTFTLILNSPSVLIGDVLLLPLTSLLIAYFYQTNYSKSYPLDSYFWTIILAIGSSCVTLWFSRHFNPVNRWWLPHGIFHFLTTYAIVVFTIKGLLLLIENGAGLQRWIIWSSVLILIAAHQTLETIFPKRFPNP